MEKNVSDEENLKILDEEIKKIKQALDKNPSNNKFVIRKQIEKLEELADAREKLIKAGIRSQEGNIATRFLNFPDLTDVIESQKICASLIESIKNSADSNIRKVLHRCNINNELEVNNKILEKLKNEDTKLQVILKNALSELKMTKKELEDNLNNSYESEIYKSLDLIIKIINEN